jgi:hypothetical protein
LVIQGIPEDFTSSDAVAELQKVCDNIGARFQASEGSGEGISGDGNNAAADAALGLPTLSGLTSVTEDGTTIECDPGTSQVRARYMLTLVAIDKGQNEATIESHEVLIKQAREFEISKNWNSSTLGEREGYRPQYAIQKTHSNTKVTLCLSPAFLSNRNPSSR